MEDAQGKFNSNFFDKYQEKLMAFVADTKALSKVQEESLGEYSSEADDRKFSPTIEASKQGVSTNQVILGRNGDAGANAQMASFAETIASTSQSLEEGTISVEDYFNSFTDAYNNNNIESIFSNIDNYSASTQATIINLADSLAQGLSEGFDQATKQLKAGTISLTDYNKVSIASTKAALTMSAGLKKVSGTYKDWAKYLETGTDTLDKYTDEQED